MALWGFDINYYILSGISAFSLYFMIQSKGKKPIKIIRLIFKRFDEAPLAIFVDSVITSLLGAIICTIITQPTNYQQSVISGLGWTGLVNGFGTPHIMQD
jgi:hypothetical protein